MSLLAMPLLYINLGVEMVYILDQRLRAQEIPPDKGERVLNDVVRKMFDKDCIDKLFVPCELYSTSAVRKCMDALAHSSIMRLSETSMDKLFDLMMMGVKYQIMCSTKLEGILQITLLHLSQLRSLLAPLADSSASLALLSNVETRVQQTYGQLGPGALHLLRQNLMRYFLDRRVKVSLFLQEGIQSTTGRWILPSPSSPYAGTITYYDGQGGLELQEKLKLKALEGLDPQEFYIHPAPLGSNLYNKDRPKVVPPPRKGDALQAPPGPWDDMGLAGEGKAQYATDVADRTDAKGARQELALLSALLSIKPQSNNFKLSLFDEEPAAGGVSLDKATIPSFKFGEGKHQYKEGMLAALKLDDASKGKASGKDELLDLLDSAS